ncbi:MAG: OprO/OprP family phosphate-selective porin [Croceibacterium sp.]
MIARNVSLSVLALASACGWAIPAQAQDAEAAAIQQELAVMRAQMAEMAARVEALQAKLDQADAKASAAEVAGVAAAAKEAASESPVAVSWKGAPLIEGKGGWSFKPRGRLQFDAGWTEAPASAGRSDGFGSEARRIRLGVEGDIPGGFGYKVEADFADGVEVTDAILTYGHKGVTVSVGQHNPFQGLEELTSSRFSSMIERAAFTDAFGFERRVGASVQYAAGDVLVQGGVFSDNIDALPNKGFSVDGRAVYMRKVRAAQLHFAGSAHHADLANQVTAARYRQRPLVHFTSERFVDTGTFGAASETGYGLEAAAISGPFHFAAEGFWQSVARPGMPDPTFFGGYAEVGLFLTRGDTRGYKSGTFDRVKPAKQVGEGGIGAVQVNLRYDHLDLTDVGIVGGTQKGYLASLVWTPTDYTRFLLNYGRMDYTDAAHPAAGGDTSYSVDAVGMRAQVDF